MSLVSRQAPDFTVAAVLGTGEIVNKYNFKEATKGKYFPPEIEEGIKEAFQQYQNLISDLENELRLVHSDFSAGNIQINDGGIVGIFDFEWSHIGDPLWDLQKLPINYQLGNGFSRENFLKGYGMENPTEEERIRVKMYTIHQGLWEIWATKTQLFPFGEKEIKEGQQLVNSAVLNSPWDIVLKSDRQILG